MVAQPATARGPLPRAAEFFAGVGLVRMGLEQAGLQVVFANDNNLTKRDIYALNFDASCFVCKDVRNLHGYDVPDIEVAVASFPCTDLSQAGNRAGLRGKDSGLLYEFIRILGEMGGRRPGIVALENVTGFAISNGGQDLRDALAALNQLDYLCDVIVLDARSFVPQSRERLFVVAARQGLVVPGDWLSSEVRPEWVVTLPMRFPELRLQAVPWPPLPPLPRANLEEIVEAMQVDNPQWWDLSRETAFLESLSSVNRKRLNDFKQSATVIHRTAYRRTRHGKAVWEIRGDSISGCLRTSRGGSSKQAIVEAGQGNARVRWMTAREYARLQGAPEFQWGDATESQAKFALGDAVCVPAVAWLARSYLAPAACKIMHCRNRTQMELALGNA
ncbi:MAG: DNA cytosine methyltransferase [SAR202 cluster bacterium]|nr:DNA cytosine methyltransferase [SAR202 cluster bacterium]